MLDEMLLLLLLWLRRHLMHLLGRWLLKRRWLLGLLLLLLLLVVLLRWRLLLLVVLRWLLLLLAQANLLEGRRPSGVRRGYVETARLHKIVGMGQQRYPWTVGGRVGVDHRTGWSHR